VSSWQVLSTVRQLGLKPKRTLRVVMWSCEEFGGVGSQQYYEAHKANASLFSLAAETDMGTFTPQGISFTGGPNATAIMQQVASLLTPINASLLLPNGGETDNSPWGASVRYGEGMCASCF
jgi:carboxypeptidase Q